MKTLDERVRELSKKLAKVRKESSHAKTQAQRVELLTKLERLWDEWEKLMELMEDADRAGVVSKA